MVVRVLAYPAYNNNHVNPFTSLLYNNMPDCVEVKDINSKDLLTGNFDVLHLHWAPENITRDSNLFLSLFKTISLLSLFSLNKLLRRKRIVQTIHDNVAHSITHKRLYRLTKICIDLLTTEYMPLEEYHGHYRDHYPNNLHPEIARQELRLSKPSILFFGTLEPYKGLEHLYEAYKPISEDYHLLVAGKIGNESVIPVLKKIDQLQNSRMYPWYVDPYDVQRWFNAADLVVLPFNEILNSGSAILALSFNKPLLVPHKGNLEHLHNKFPGWVSLYSGELKPAMITEAIANKPKGKVDTPKLAWPKISKEVYENYYV